MIYIQILHCFAYNIFFYLLLQMMRDYSTSKYLLKISKSSDYIPGLSFHHALNTGVVAAVPSVHCLCLQEIKCNNGIFPTEFCHSFTI